MKRFYWSILAGIFFSGLYFFLCFNAPDSLLLHRWSAGTQDLLFKFRHATEGAPKEIDKVVIVSIDDESCEKLGLRWPWPRKTFASLVNRLNEEGAKAIALNFSFTGSESEGDEGTRALAEAMQPARVVVGATMDRQKLIKPNPILLETNSRYGYLEKIIDEDFAIRRSYPFRDSANGMSGSSVVSFPVELARIANDFHEDQIVVNPDGSYDINYLAKEDDFNHVPAWKVLEHKISDGLIHGKVVLVGATSELFSEKHATPLGLMPGVIVHANEYIAITSGRYLRSGPAWLEVGIAWALSLMLLFLILSRRIWLGLLGAVGFFFCLRQCWRLSPVRRRSFFTYFWKTADLRKKYCMTK